ncbi:MAG: nuclear transport factor 2 family protein [Bifidobacteriaceae bacterium]|nr:nuclear transport factor 2 family protein [Bifidobacteriaceae bacterium]
MRGESASGAGPSARERNRRIVTDFYTLAFIRLEHEAAAAAHLTRDYIQHNPFVPDGRDGFVQFFKDFDLAREPGYEHRILRTVADEDLVAVHCLMKSSRSPFGVALVDIFHVTAEGLIDEHWDVFKELADPATLPHANGEIDDIVRVRPGDANLNRWALVDFWTMAFVQKRYAAAAAKHFGDRYVQHNSFVADAVEGFTCHFEGSSGHRQETYCQIPLRFIVDEEYGAVHEWLRPDVTDTADRGVMIVDIFRFDRGKIVEHWDVFTPRWAPADSANARGMI